MTLYHVLGLTGIAILFATLATAWYLASRAISPQAESFEESRARELDSGIPLRLLDDVAERPEVTIESPFGYRLNAAWIESANRRKAMLLIHGITRNRYGSAKYAEIFAAMGFSCLLIDLRAHGSSGGKHCTFGYYETADIAAWVAWLREKLGSDAMIGLHGESLGGAIALQYAATDPGIRFVIADCPFSDLRGLLVRRLRDDYHLPPFPFIYLASRFARLRTRGLRFELISPLKAALSFENPVFFIHGQEDSYTPCEMSVLMHQARTDKGLPSRLFIAPGAAHAKSYDINPAIYRAEIRSFLAPIIDHPQS